jgi:hypothetical protein
MAESASGLTVPLFGQGIRSPRDGQRYWTTIMGGQFDPTQFTHQTTTVPLVLIPLVVHINGTVFDPTQTAYGPPPSCPSVGVPVTLTQNSPLFQNVPYTWNGNYVGTTQYIDAFQRGEFWNDLGILECSSNGNAGGGGILDEQTGSGNDTMCWRGGTTDWHTRFAVTTTAAQDFYPSAGGVGTNGCAQVGAVDYSELQTYIENTLLPNLHVSPTTFPVILMENVFAATNSFKTCCILGFHGAYGSPMQVYAVAEFDTRSYFGATTADVSDLSHELAEAVNDPTGLNPTPAWGHIGQVSGCQNNLEVGDPLTGTLMPGITLSGFTYHLQELAFYSWFMGTQDGMSGWYSSNGTFTAAAGAVCH